MASIQQTHVGGRGRRSARSRVPRAAARRNGRACAFDKLDGGVEQRLVGNDPARLDAAGGGDDDLGLASSMRVASSFAAKPPKTTEWTAPRRAQASIAITASGTIGM
jgi:hypothetical protein